MGEAMVRADGGVSGWGVGGKVALVTGAGRGIGRAIALALGRAGALVAVQDIELSAASEVVGEIEALGAQGVAVGGDCTRHAFAAEVHAEVVEKLGAVSILVNNAGVQAGGEKGRWDSADVETIEWQWRGNVLTPWLLTRLCVQEMRAGGWGRVLNISSIQGIRGNPNMLAYSTSKAALDHQTRALARELAPHGITINAIAPGWFDTHRNRGDFASPEEKAKKGEYIPAKRIGEPEDVVGTALMLCSDAGAYVTGQVIYVDGGMSAR